MFIVINSENRIIASATYQINEEDCASRGERVQFIDNLKYDPAMIGSLYVDSDPYFIVAPSTFHEIVNNQWTFTEKSAQKCLETATIVRNKLLAATDWTLLPDSPLNAEEQEHWKQIRQELRTIKETVSDPLEVIKALDSYALMIIK